MVVSHNALLWGYGEFLRFVGEYFKMPPISLWVLKIPFFKNQRMLMLNKLIHVGVEQR
ncbi:hypothetical protein IZT76_01690 [Helicobacter pylori]|uniref:hypothetical protein n=1 Tax=Helicobacter pylori TaxID=210 RepID=UPI0018E0FFCC|nr:hypothetical protein [Helicobacter pylori]MBI1560989.1 hypothetical protein [Helicobacter pylori]